MARHYGVTDGRRKLIHYYQLGEWELFDLEKDPNELMNMYASPDYAPIRQQLEAELKRLRGLYQVPEKDPDANRKRTKRASR